MCRRIFIFMCLMMFCLTATNFVTAQAQSSKTRLRDVIIKEEPFPDSFSEQPSQPLQPSAPVFDRDMSEYLTGKGVTMIGDSIMNGNRSIILNQLPDALIDAKGSRDVCGGFEAAKKLQWEGNLSDVVIVELGTNGPLLRHEPYASGTQNLLELLGTERQIFWVTVYCSYSQWMAMNNEYIWELSQTRPNITVIDWYSLAVNHPEWFPDGVHPNVEGARNFAKLLREALQEKYGGTNYSE